MARFESGRMVAGGALLLLVGIVGCAATVQIASVPHPLALPDSDSDGVANGSDECEGAKEDGKAPLAKDGCPVDADGDGIKGEADKCADKPETVNGFQDADGCPDAAPVAARRLQEPAEYLPSCAETEGPSWESVLSRAETSRSPSKPAQRA